MHASCPTLGGTKWTVNDADTRETFRYGDMEETRGVTITKSVQIGKPEGESVKIQFMLGNEVVGQCSRSCCAKVKESEYDVHADVVLQTMRRR